MEHGQVTSTLMPAPGCSRLPLSSTARTRMFAFGLPCTIQLYDHCDVPVAGCHFAPPFVETSTPATTPPPASVAVPDKLTRLPSCAAVGASVIVEVGAELSVEGEAGTTPWGGVAGCAPMSAKRLTVACCMFRPGAVPAGFQRSSPQDHCTVPAPKTRAPLGTRYMTKLWVAV